MPFHDSRLGPGTLLLGTTPGTEYGFQVAALALTPAVNENAGTPTLAVPEPAPEVVTDYTLDGDAINDFEAVAGLGRWCYDHDGETHDFVWTPNSTGATPATLTGQAQIRAFPQGGKVGEQLVTSFSFPTVGKPVWAGGAATLMADEQSGRKGSR